MNTENGVDPKARSTEWIVICILFVFTIYKIIVPGQTDSLPATSWNETIGNRQLLLGFSVVCAEFVVLGTSTGYHGLSWHFTKASLNYRIAILANSMLPTWIVLWMQKRFHFIAGEVHLGITSACFILGILIGSAVESRNQHPGPPRFGLTIMHISVAVIGGIWSTVAAEKVSFLRFTIPIHHNAFWSVSLIGALVGWVISILLEHHVKYSLLTSILLSSIALVHLVVLLVLPVSSIFALLHEVSLHQFEGPTVIVAVLTGINSGVTMGPAGSSG